MTDNQEVKQTMTVKTTLSRTSDGDGDISEEIIATCEYMDDVSIQRDLLKRYLLSTVERLTSANSLASTQHFSSCLEPAAASVTFDSCGRGTCSSIGAESGAQAPQAMATAGWNPAAALAKSTPGGPSTLATCRDPDDALLDRVKHFWDLEASGITSNEHTVHEAFKQSITHDGERYTVHLPWREMHPALPDGYHLSKKRLESTFRILKKSPDILKEYDTVIQDQLKCGIVERVVSTNDIPDKVHYLPHHPVIRQAKTTTKVRVVYDASAKTGSNPSLNECLHAGPSLLDSIPDILLCFRTNKVALVGDVEKAFLMVGITEADRDVLRFLWFDDAMAEAPTPVVLRFARVIFGVSQRSDDQCSDFTQ